MEKWSLLVMAVLGLFFATNASSDPEYVGTWAENQARCEPEGDTVPMVIRENEITFYESWCRFKSVSKHENTWSAQAECSGEGETWTNNFEMTVTGDSLIFASNNSSAERYERCQPISIYFAADTPPAPTERTPESALCYRFKVTSLDEQLGKLLRKYSGAIRDGKIEPASDGGRILTAHRFDDTGKRIDYFYSDRPELCNLYQEARGISINDKEIPQSASLDVASSTEQNQADSEAMEEALEADFPGFVERVKAGDPEAQYQVALRYSEGTRDPLAYQEGSAVDKDPVAAAYWFRKAAEQGHAGAQNSLGYSYRFGLGVAENLIEAAAWYRRAAEQGHALGEFNLALAYANGLGVPTDEIEAVKWYQRAAAQGVVGAQNNLGVMYENGKGIPQDYAEAAKWYRLSAEQGNAIAQTNLGVMYELGRGVLQDWVMAYALYNIAAANGDERAISKRETLSQKLTRRQINQGQDMTRSGKPGGLFGVQSAAN